MFHRLGSGAQNAAGELTTSVPWSDQIPLADGGVNCPTTDVGVDVALVAAGTTVGFVCSPKMPGCATPARPTAAGALPTFVIVLVIVPIEPKPIVPKFQLVTSGVSAMTAPRGCMRSFTVNVSFGGGMSVVIVSVSLYAPGSFGSTVAPPSRVALGPGMGFGVIVIVCGTLPMAMLMGRAGAENAKGGGLPGKGPL